MGLFGKTSYAKRVEGELKVIRGVEKAKAGLKQVLLGKDTKK